MGGSVGVRMYSIRVGGSVGVRKYEWLGVWK